MSSSWRPVAPLAREQSSSEPSAGKGGWILLIALAGLLASVELGHWALGIFRMYDDQGYVMLTLKQYREGHPLYDAVFSQYGPAYYLIRDWLYGSAAVSHDLTALVCTAHAIVCCALLAAVAFALTRSRWCLLAVLLIAPNRAGEFVNEAGHPQETIGVLVLLATLAVVLPLRAPYRGAVVGASAGLVALIKPNVGVFLALPAVLTLLQQCPPNGTRDAGVRLLKSLLLILPFVLIRPHLHDLWGMSFAVLVSASLLPMLMLSASTREGGNARGLVSFVGSMLAVVLLVIAHQLARGSTANGLWQGLVLQPLRMSSLYVNPFAIGYPSITIAGAALLAFGCTRLRQPPRELIGVAALLFGGLLCAWMLRPGAHAYTKYLTPFLWLAPMAAATRKGEPAPDVATSFVSTSAVFLVLQAYPVAASQVACGTILYPILAVTAVHDGLLILKESPPHWLRAGLLRSTVPMLLLGCLSVRGIQTFRSVRKYWHNTPLNLPGASLYRLPAPQTETLRWTTAHVAQFDTFVTMPGINSLYFFAQKNPPSTSNTTAWMTLLDDAPQEQVVKRLATFSSVGGIRIRKGVESWARGHDVSAKPLVRYFEQQMRAIDERGGIELVCATPTPGRWQPIEKR